MIYRYLYRALRKIEIESGYILIPKCFDEFKSNPKFGIDTTLPFRFKCEENSVRQHQWQQNGLPTRGISTSPIYERALFYAQENRIIVKIDSLLFDNLGIKLYDVNEILSFRKSDIAVPEDNEIIIVYREDDYFPSEIIKEIIKI